MKKIVFVAPLMAISLLASCGNNKPTFTVTWKNYDGTVLETDERVPYGTIPSYDNETPTKPMDDQCSYAFSGWTPDIKKPITKDTIFTAQFFKSFDVTFDSDNGEDSIIVPVRCNNLFPKEDIPNPKKEDKYKYYTFDGWYQVIDGEMKEEAFNFDETIITEHITLRAKWNEGKSRHYKITGIPSEEGALHFTLEGEPQTELTNIDIEAGQDFKFMMRIKNTSEYEQYRVPKMVDIFVGDNEVPLNNDYCFSIIRGSEATQATIKIFGKYVTGDITVKASPVINNQYYLSVKSYGVESDSESKVCSISEEVTIQFSKDSEGHDFPGANNFYIKIDEKQWGPLSSYTDYCEYNNEEHKLKIKENTVGENVSIIVRSPYPSYNLLEDLSWSQINDIAYSEWAQIMFYLGETKTVKINGIKHTAKVIGFNHDQITGAGKGTKAKVTFEFFNVITNSSGVEKVAWNSSDKWHSSVYNYDFPNYSLNSYLNKDSNCLFNRLPTDLQNVIKKVKKDVTRYKNGKYTNDPYDAKLFPLSTYEMIGSLPERAMKEGEQYAYWKTHNSNNDRIKKGVGKSSASSYWMRTPRAQYNVSDHAYAILDDGTYEYNPSIKETIGIAPAFCI